MDSSYGIELVQPANGVYVCGCAEVDFAIKGSFDDFACG